MPVAYTNPGHGPKPFQQPESMGKRRQASPAPFDLEANDIYLSRARLRLKSCERGQARRVRRGAVRARGYGLSWQRTTTSNTGTASRAG